MVAPSPEIMNGFVTWSPWTLLIVNVMGEDIMLFGRQVSIG